MNSVAITGVINMKEHRLYDHFSKYMASPKEIVREGISKALGPNMEDSNYIKKNFSYLVTLSEQKAYEAYLDNQKSAWKRALDDYLKPTLIETDPKKSRADFLYNHFDELNSFFLSLSQSRKARGGGAFQYIIKDLLNRLDYPFTEEPVINGKPDFLFPSKEYFLENPVDCVIFTVKRMIRERWRQIVTEGTQGLGFFLATIDDKISENQIHEMSTNRIFLVVPQDLKSHNTIYSDASNVISFEIFFEDFLDPKVRRWARNGVL